MIYKKGLLKIEKLKNVTPDMSEPSPFGFLDRGRGESVYLNSEKNINFVGVLEFLPGLGVRGKHYHRAKKEMMYVVEGKIKGYFWLPEDPTQMEEFVLEKGDFITITPGLAHAFDAVTRTLMVELSPQFLEQEDVFYPNNFIEPLVESV